jgi:DNA (cytosine-5)-methyltransferase 1
MSLPESIDEPLRTITTKDRHGLIAPVIDKYYATGVASDPSEPLDTATAKARFGLTSAFMEQANTGVVGHDAREPVSTLLAAGSHQRPIEVEMAPQEAAATSRRARVVAFLREHFGEPTEAEIANPTGTLMARVRHGLVLIGKAVWQIADIGMRMLTPRELYNAQGFPKDYIIDRTAAGPLTKTAQTRMAGNSVCPPWAAAIIRANDPLRQRELRAAA